MENRKLTFKTLAKKKVLKYQRNLYSTFIISLLVPVLIAVISFLIYTNYSMEKRERQDMRNMLDSVSQNIEMKFTEVADIGRVYYSQKDVFKEAEYLNNPKLYQYYGDLARSQMESSYSEIITKLIHTSAQSVRSVVFFPMNENNESAYYIGRDQSVLTEIFYGGYHEEDWFEQAVGNPENIVFYEPHIPAYLGDKETEQVYSCISAIRDMDSKKIIGVVKIDADIAQMQEGLNVLGSGHHGFVLSKGEQTFMKSDALESVPDSKNYQIERRTVRGTDMELTYFYSKNSFYKGYSLVIGFAVLIIAAGVLLAFEVYRRRTREMIEDVRHITEVMELAGNGEMDSRIEIRSQNEIGEIANVINKMMDNLKSYIEQEYLFVIQNQKAEYRALQSQINPHFLYNTLNGFVALNRMGETKVLEKSIISLSHLFRYTCKAGDVVDIQSEFRFLEEYLELEKLKYEERLEYMIWMDEESGRKPIPKLLLQPIVENSIVHGMGVTDEPVLINISAISQELEGLGRVTIISIRDNGCGYDSCHPETEEDHVGMKNVQARAELFCKEMIYQSVSRKGNGTKTTFVFPEKE